MLLKICPNNLSFNKRKHHFKFERDRQEMKMLSRRQQSNDRRTY
jgi:hypothetical protein